MTSQNRLLNNFINYSTDRRIWRVWNKYCFMFIPKSFPFPLLKGQSRDILSSVFFIYLHLLVPWRIIDRFFAEIFKFWTNSPVNAYLGSCDSLVAHSLGSPFLPAMHTPGSWDSKVDNGRVICHNFQVTHTPENHYAFTGGFI